MRKRILLAMRIAVVLGMMGGVYYKLYEYLVRTSLSDATAHPRYRWHCGEDGHGCGFVRLPATVDYPQVWVQLGLAVAVPVLLVAAYAHRRRDKAYEQQH